MTTLLWTVMAGGFYCIAGCCIGLSMVLTGGSVAGYLVGLLFAVPASALFGIRFGVIGMLGFTVLIERIIDYKLYS